MDAYIIRSAHTGDVYISETRDAFVCGDESSARALTKKIKDTTVKKVSKDKNEILTLCRDAGASRARFMGKYIDLCDENTQNTCCCRDGCDGAAYLVLSASSHQLIISASEH